MTQTPFDKIPIWIKCPITVPEGFVVRKGDHTTPDVENQYWVQRGSKCVEFTGMITAGHSLHEALMHSVRLLGGELAS